jgi:hypothetical protein
MHSVGCVNLVVWNALRTCLRSRVAKLELARAEKTRSRWPVATELGQLAMYSGSKLQSPNTISQLHATSR